MGKHNGKSRSSGLKVGAALANRAKKVRAAVWVTVLTGSTACGLSLVFNKAG